MSKFIELLATGIQDCYEILSKGKDLPKLTSLDIARGLYSEGALFGATAMTDGLGHSRVNKMHPKIKWDPEIVNDKVYPGKEIEYDRTRVELWFDKGDKYYDVKVMIPIIQLLMERIATSNFQNMEEYNYGLMEDELNMTKEQFYNLPTNWESCWHEHIISWFVRGQGIRFAIEFEHCSCS